MAQAATYSALTADGTNLGVVTVTDTSVFSPGAFGFLLTTVTASPVKTVQIRIISITDSTHLVVALQSPGQPNVGPGDVSAFTVAKNAYISASQEVVTSGSAQASGTFTLINGSVTVTEPSIVSSSRVLLTRVSGGALFYATPSIALIPSVGFTVYGSFGDNSTWNYEVSN